VGDHHVLMPGFGEKSFLQSLSDEQIATLATFVRQTFGPGDAVSVAQVATARKGGPSSMLLPIARIGLVAVAVVLFGLALWALRRRAHRQI
jgi:hypothetical protein